MEILKCKGRILTRYAARPWTISLKVGRIEEALEAITFLFKKEKLFNNLPISEYFMVMYLTRDNYVMGYHIIGQGSEVTVPVDNKLIIKTALDVRANAIVAVHNHPTQVDLKVSVDDRRVTRELQRMCDVMNIGFLEHFVINYDCTKIIGIVHEESHQK